jgi:hypothetical protein
MRWIAALLWISSLGTPCFCAEEPRPKPPELTVTKLAKPAPKIDGVLDDAAWKDAAVITQFMRTHGMESETKCRVLITYDDANLYLAADCPEPPAQMEKLRAEATKHDEGKIWEDDEVEFFMDPAGKHGYPYYQIIVNWKGVTLDAFVTAMKEHDLAWEPKYDAQVAVGKEGWTIELAIPFTAFDRTDASVAEWNFNFLHVRSIGEQLYWSAPFGESSHTPWFFGKLKGMPVRPLKGK